MRIHYRRPPGRVEVFRQLLVHDEAAVKVTFARGVALAAPVEIEGRQVLEAGADAVWFTFPGAWHDIGRFHRADGAFTGIYANVLTPPVFEPGHVWRTTDLFLDVWLPPGGEPRVLDRDELDHAAAAGWIDSVTRLRALEEVDRILDATEKGLWPPPIVHAWTVERARQAADAPAL